MPIYILLTTLTADGRKTLKDNPERILEVNKEIEGMGAKVIHQYASLGPYDFVNILEAPNNDIVFRISAELGSRGTVHIMSMPAIPVEELISSIKK